MRKETPAQAIKRRLRARRYYNKLKKNKKHVAKRRAYFKKWRSSLKGMACRLLQDARSKSRRLGLAFNLTLDDCIVPAVCPVFGTKLQCGVNKPHKNSPTLDRLNPKRGYVKGNVAVISQYANALKHNGTAAQHRRIAEWMEASSV